MKVTTAIRLKGKPCIGSKKKPVTIRVTYQRVPHYFAFDLKLTPEDFKKLPSEQLGERLTGIRKIIYEQHDRAKAIIQRLNPFTFPDFSKEFYAQAPAFHAEPEQELTGEPPKIMNVISEEPEPDGYTFSGHTRRYGKRKFERIRSNIDFKALGPLAEIFGDYIRDLEAEERIGTSESYFSTLMSLIAHRKGLRMEDITKPFLLGYQKWMTESGKKLTTVGIYLRNLRALFNLQIDEGKINKELYPFGKGRRQYKIPTGKNTKKFLELSEIKVLFDHTIEADNFLELLGRDMWFFLFYGNGMNPKDLAMLKYKDMDDDYIRFVREKTKNTTVSDPMTITIPLNDDLRGYIARWGNQDKRPDNYIFPVLKHGLSPHRQKELVQLFIKIINKSVGKIAKKYGIKKPVGCMYARHSYVTIMLRAGADTEYVRQSLGHMSFKTTQSYIGSFEDTAKKELSGRLVAFKNLPAIGITTASEAV